MAAFTSKPDPVREHPGNETVYCRTREEVIEATRAELAELFVQRRVLLERLARGHDSPRPPFKRLRAGLTRKVRIQCRISIPRAIPFRSLRVTEGR